MRNSTASIVSLIATIIVVAIVAFFIAVAVKSGIDGTSFVDTINSIFGVTAAADPVTPTPTPDAETASCMGIF